MPSPRLTRTVPRLERLDRRDVPAILASPAFDGVAADGDSTLVLGISEDGARVLFASTAGDLVSGVTDTNGTPDLFLRDTSTGSTQLVSVGSGKAAVGYDLAEVGGAVLSANGLFVAWVATAPASAVTGDAGQTDAAATADVFRWSSATGVNQLVSARNSGDGDTVAVGATAGFEAFTPQISGTGEIVAFVSNLPNDFITGELRQDDASSQDIFARSMTPSNAGGASTLAVSANAANPTFMIGFGGDVFVEAGRRYMDENGTRFAFSTDVDLATVIIGVTDGAGTLDVVAADTSVAVESSLELASPLAGADLTAAGSAGIDSANPVLSGDGTAVLFLSNAPGGAGAELVDGYVANGAGNSLYQRSNLFNGGLTILVNAVEGTLNAAGTSDNIAAGTYDQTFDGKTIAFESTAADLIGPNVADENGVADVYVRDYRGESIFTELVSVGTFGRTGSEPSLFTGISDDGRFVLFETASADVVIGTIDANGVADVFTRDRTLLETRAVSVLESGRFTGNGTSGSSLLAPTGTAAAFSSSSTDLDFGRGGEVTNVFTSTVPGPNPIGLSTALLVSGTDDTASQTYVLGASGQYELFETTQPLFEGYIGEVRTAVGDIDGDGTEDFVYGVGPGGGSLIRVILSSGTELSYQIYEDAFRGGLFLAAGDIEGDGFAEVFVTPDQGGGGRVVGLRWDGTDLVRFADYFGIDDPNFRGGARLALGDVTGDGYLDVVVAAGFGGGPRVAVFDGLSVTQDAAPTKPFGDFLVFEPGLRNGTFVASGDLNGDGLSDLIFGGGPGGGPRLLALDANFFAGGNDDPAGAIAAPLANFFAGSPASRGGLRLIAKDVDGDGRADIVTGSGEDDPAEARVYLGRDLPAGGQGEPPAFQILPLAGSAALPAGIFVG